MRPLKMPDYGRVMIFAGGIPLKRGGEIVGGIRVSDGDGGQDEKCRMPASLPFNPACFPNQNEEKCLRCCQKYWSFAR